MKHIIFASTPMFVCGIVMFMLLLDLLQRPTRALRTLVIFMGVTTLLYMAHCIYFLRKIAFIPISDTIYSTANPLVFPLYYIYIKCLTKYKADKKVIIMLITPSLLCGGAVGILYLLMNDQEQALFIHGYLYHGYTNGAKGVVGAQIVAHQAVKWIFGIEIFPILYLGLRRIRHYDMQLERLYSSTDDTRLKMVKVMLFLFMGACLFSFINNIIGRYRFANNMDLLAIPSVLFSLLLFFIGYIGMKEKGIEELDEMMEAEKEDAQKARPETTDLMESTRHDEESPSVQAKEVADRSKGQTLRQRIEYLMQEKRMYLQPQLKLNDLVTALNSNRNYVYQAINVEMGISFAEYVNRMRIDYAKQLMRSNPSLSFADIAIKSGFASSVSFYRNFRLFVGCSPQEYKSSETIEEST